MEEQTRQARIELEQAQARKEQAERDRKRAEEEEEEERRRALVEAENRERMTAGRGRGRVGVGAGRGTGVRGRGVLGARGRGESWGLLPSPFLRPPVLIYDTVVLIFSLPVVSGARPTTGNTTSSTISGTSTIGGGLRKPSGTVPRR
jgi:hypothetical protein